MDLFCEFIKLRKAKHKPLVTERGIKARIKRLESLSGNDMVLKAKILEQTLENEWLDFYEIKDNQSASRWEKLL